MNATTAPNNSRKIAIAVAAAVVALLLTAGGAFALTLSGSHGSANPESHKVVKVVKVKADKHDKDSKKDKGHKGSSHATSGSITNGHTSQPNRSTVTIPPAANQTPVPAPSNHAGPVPASGPVVPNSSHAGSPAVGPSPVDGGYDPYDYSGSYDPSVYGTGGYDAGGYDAGSYYDPDYSSGTPGDIINTSTPEIDAYTEAANQAYQDSTTAYVNGDQTAAYDYNQDYLNYTTAANDAYAGYDTSSSYDYGSSDY